MEAHAPHPNILCCFCPHCPASLLGTHLVPEAQLDALLLLWWLLWRPVHLSQLR